MSSKLLRLAKLGGATAAPRLGGGLPACCGRAHPLHTAAATGLGQKWQIPDRLQDIAEAENPNFFSMVEYYFHKACLLAEDSLIAELSKMRGASDSEKRNKVHGILKARTTTLA